MALAQLLSIGTENGRQVCKLGDRGTEGFIDKDLPGRVRQMAFTPDYMRYFHEKIVNDTREIVGWAFVASQYNGITDLRRIHIDSSIYEVVETYCALPDSQPQCRCGSGVVSLLHFSPRQFPAFPRIVQGFIAGYLRFAHFFQLLLRAEAPKCLIFIKQTFGVPLIDWISIALPIGPEFSIPVNSFIPIEAKPSKILQELSFIFGFAS